MRNPNQTQTANRQIEFLDLLDELNQHILQAKAVVDFLSVDFGENQGFTASDNTVSGMLWAVQTLLNNAENVSGKMNQWNKQGGR